MVVKKLDKLPEVRTRDRWGMNPPFRTPEAAKFDFEELVSGLQAEWNAGIRAPLVAALEEIKAQLSVAQERVHSLRS